jgi:hypothetical protein
MTYSVIALILSIIATLPQLYQTLTTGLVRDYHEWSPIIAIAANFFIALQGYVRKDIGLMILGAWFIMFNSVIAYYKQSASALLPHHLS